MPIDNQLLWPNWIEFLKKEKEAKFVAQGTLINKHSISQTLAQAIIHGPVLVPGVVRIFNFMLADGNYVEHGGRYQRSAYAMHCATLNILDTADPKNKLNGVLFTTPISEIDSLAEREFGYDLLPVEYQLEEENDQAYMFIARPNSKYIGDRVRDDILPNESSLEICMQGAATYGPGFLDMWIGSCYLANRTPLIAHPYYRELVSTLSSDTAS